MQTIENARTISIWISIKNHRLMIWKRLQKLFKPYQIGGAFLNDYINSPN